MRHGRRRAGEKAGLPIKATTRPKEVPGVANFKMFRGARGMESLFPKTQLQRDFKGLTRARKADHDYNSIGLPPIFVPKFLYERFQKEPV